MTTTLKLTLAAMAGVLIGAVGAPAIQARQPSPAPGYFVAELEVTDPAAMKSYGEKVPETLAPFNHQYLVRSSKIQTLEGEPPKAASW